MRGERTKARHNCWRAVSRRASDIRIYQSTLGCLEVVDTADIFRYFPYMQMRYLKIAAAASRVAATDAFNFAAQENIQTHGGIGFTWEADTQFYYRRSQVLGLSLGSIASWKNKLVTQLEEKNN